VFYVGKILLDLEPLVQGSDLPGALALLLTQVMSTIPQNLLEHIQKSGIRSEAGELLLETVENMVARLLCNGT
jgi:hypothetical protein